MNWYYFQTKENGPIIRVQSKQMPKPRSDSYIVYEYHKETGKYEMACFPEIYGGRLLKMTYVGKTKVADKLTNKGRTL